jgi:hypothetical protein
MFLKIAQGFADYHAPRRVAAIAPCHGGRACNNGRLASRRPLESGKRRGDALVPLSAKVL